MKFIRDIIGEKRQMERSANGTQVSTPVDSILADAILTDDAQSPDVDALLNDEVTVEDLAATEPETGSEPDEELATFLAQDEDADETMTQDAADSDADRPSPSRLVLGSSMLVEDGAPQMQPDEAAEAPAETASDEDIMREVDRALVPDAQPDETMEALFRSPNEKSADAGAPETGQPDADEGAPAPNARPARPSEFVPRQEAAQAAAPEADPAPQPPESVQVPPPAAVGRGSSRHGRVKTRLLGFNSAPDTGIDPLAQSAAATPAAFTTFPVGWLIIVTGPGRGSAFTLFNGVSNIGRGEDQTVRLDFGDNSISRENHASIAFDPRQKGFFIGHGGKANIVRLNDRPVLSTEEMSAGDHITIGETTMRFVPFCGPDFSWEDDAQDRGQAYARRD